jgi:hypothetical protein
LLFDVLAQLGGRAIEAAEQLLELRRRRVLEQWMYVVVLAVGLDQRGGEVGAHVGEHGSTAAQVFGVKRHDARGREDQLRMEDGQHDRPRASGLSDPDHMVWR